jgi:hypothetical protein
MKKVSLVEAEFLKVVDLGEPAFFLKKEDVKITIKEEVTYRKGQYWDNEDSKGKTLFIDINFEDILFIMEGDILSRLNSIGNKEFIIMNEIYLS